MTGRDDISSEICPTPQRLTLRKGEKLRHRSLVEQLFREGQTLYDFPLRLTWRKLSAAELDATFRDHVPEPVDSLQMLITVPKKKRRHAVDRVLMRRRIREAYRLNRLPLKATVEEATDVRTLGMAIIYLHDKNLPYSTIENKMRLLLKKLAKKINPGIQSSPQTENNTRE
ncbi:MAG: ribonuclease P protein component [Muribaculaceae bacterium]|nr:ribonuclease P protein component [Muribaculaceae bacterium]